MFQERLTAIAERIEGAAVVALVSDDGIPIESVLGAEDVDLEMLCAEIVALVRSIEDNHRELDVGEVRQFTVRTERFDLVTTTVTSHYYLLCVVASGATLGQVRFELARGQLSLVSDLED